MLGGDMGTAADAQPGTWITVGVLVGLALALLVGVLLGGVLRARRAVRARRAAAPPPAVEPRPEAPAAVTGFPVDDLPGFLDQPPGWDAGTTTPRAAAPAAADDPAVDGPAVAEAPRTGSTAAGDAAGPTGHGGAAGPGTTPGPGGTAGLTAAVVLLVAAVVVAFVGGSAGTSPAADAAVASTPAAERTPGAAATSGAPATSGAESTLTAPSGPATAGLDPAAPTTQAPADSSATTAGSLALTSVPLGGSGVAATATFQGLVLEQRAVGLTVTYPGVSVSTDGRRALAHVRLPTFNCLTPEPPADPTQANCVPTLTEYADLTDPDLQVSRDGDRVELVGLFATYTRPNGSPPVYTGRAYQLTAAMAPDGPRDGDAVAAAGVVRIGLDSAPSVPEPGVNRLLFPG
jgi:hypothetical protein